MSNTESECHSPGEAKVEKGKFSHPALYDATPETVLVDFDGPDDPYRPMNWPFQKKFITTLLYGFTTCWITFASAIYSAALVEIKDEFQVSTEVASSGVSLMVFGFGLGPLVWGPLSEVYGRKWVVVIVSLASLDSVSDPLTVSSLISSLRFSRSVPPPPKIYKQF